MIDISQYKFNLMQDIFNTQEIVDAIDSQDPQYIPGENSSLVYANLFPFLRVPEIISREDCYILMAVDVKNINKVNNFFSDIRIVFWVMAHQERMRFSIGDRPATRIDYIGEELIRLFEGAERYGVSALELVSSREVILNEKFLYRELVFHGVDLKKAIC